MKNSKEYTGKIHKLHRSLKRKHAKVKKVEYDEPTEALVYGIIAEKMSERTTKSVLKRFDNYFVDLNDLRVSSAEEIVEKLGEETSVSKSIADDLIYTLRFIFDQYNVVSLKSIQKIGKRPARQVLERIPQLSNFAINYFMLTSLKAHAIPLTDRMIEYLEKNELVHPDADEHQIEGFLTKQISAKNGYEFYSLLRKESESARKKKKSKKKTSKKTKPKKERKTKKKTSKRTKKIRRKA
jgi:endonuclease III